MATGFLYSMKTHPWLTSLTQSITETRLQDRLPNSLLVESHPGLDEHQLVWQVSSALLCSGKHEQACGYCHSCQLFNANTHPDFHLIEPKDGKSSINIDQIRALSHQAEESSQLAGKRVFVINLAEQLNESAANALLKTLEEPSEQCFFILISYQRKRLLPTIVSRCQRWTIPTPTVLLTQQWLMNEYAISASELGLLLFGHAPMLLRDFEQSQGSKQVEKLLQALLNLMIGTGDFATFWQEVKQDTVANLDIVSILLHAALKQSVLERVPFPHVLIQSLAKELNYAKLHSLVTKLDQLRCQLQESAGLNHELLVMDWVYSNRN